MEVAQPWDLLGPLLQHWRAPQLPQSQTHAPASLACTRWAIHCISYVIFIISSSSYPM